MIKKNKAGFTIAEFIIASVIFMIATVLFSYGLISAMKLHQMSSDHYASTCIARNRIQRAKCLDFSSISLMNETLTPVDLYGNYSATGSYFRTTVVTNLSSDEKMMTVSVYFITPTGRTSDAPVVISTKIATGMYE